jgi:pyruvate dehydrogenase E1 component alpha subunit
LWLELLTYRLTGHSRRDPCHYQPKEEREEWASQDPIDRFAWVLKHRGLLDDAGLKAVKSRVRRDFDAAVGVARGQPLPTTHDLTTDVFA